MNVHLLRSKEVSEERYWDVVALLQQFKGPVKYISNESFADYERESFISEIIPDKEAFVKTEGIHYFMENNIRSQRMNFIDFPLEREALTWEQLFGKCREYRRNHDIGDEEYVVLLTDIANDKNWFMAMAESFHDAFIHTKDWDYYLDADPKHPIAYQVVEMILHTHMTTSMWELMKIVHQHPRGCVSDFVKNKKDITLKLRTADICNECQETIQQNQVPTGLVNQVLNTMEGIREQMLFRERFKYHLTPSRMTFNLLHRKAILTDIQDLFVRLTPLEATVYYFFLNHPEGVRLNDLDRHEQELYEIYSKCSVANSDNNLAAMRNRISLLTNPLENSLNEKISRIGAKFKNAMGDEMARHYIISRLGNNQKYGIRIDRKMVTVKD